MIRLNLAAIYHQAKSQYAYMYDRETLHLRLRTARTDVSSVTLIGGDPFSWIQVGENPPRWEWDKDSIAKKRMQLEYRTDLYDYWFVDVKPAHKRIRYGFVLESGNEKWLYGGCGFHDLKQNPQAEYETNYYFNYPFLNEEDLFQAPDWVKKTIWYQIFPERFTDGDPSNNPPGSLPWGSPASNEHPFYGGDLQGVIDRLDYIHDLGVNGIYFTPIFSAATNHKYDTIDYYRIDPAFGTNELFGRLVEEAHRRGIRIMLDAVFNHCGWFHPWWQDVVQKGSASQYYQCFHIKKDPVINFQVEEGKIPRLTNEERSHLNYATFAFTPLMPKWNTAHPLVKEHLFGAARYWTETYRIDGWRLDVSNEVPHAFWREFRQMIKAINPEIYILGENWDFSYPWLRGDQFDGVMNYQLSEPVWGLLAEEGNARRSLDITGYHDAINQLLTAYPKNVLPALYNLLDSHDTARISSICGQNPQKVKLAYLLQFTFSGAPSIYYGSELGLTSPQGENRLCMPWDDLEAGQELRSFLKALILMRKSHPVFSSVDMRWLVVDADRKALLFEKRDEGSRLLLLISVNPQAVTLPLPVELQNCRLNDLFRGEEVTLPEELDLPPFAFHLWLERS